LGLVVADRVGAGRAEGPVFTIAELDGDRVFGDVEGEFAVGVDATQG
jgi:hypothetical protein